MLTEKQLKQIKEELDNCKNPLFFYHDDPDGLASFLLFYRYLREGHGVPVKSTPRMDEKFLRSVEKHEPDKIFVLDIATIEDSFLNGVNVPIVWVDHHEPADPRGMKYFNPRVKDPGILYPASQICYDVIKEDFWIAMCGIVGDWVISGYNKEFSRQYPDLLPSGIKDPAKVLFETKIGTLAKLIGFILKGNNANVNKSIDMLCKVKTPYEILNQETEEGKFLWDRFQYLNKEYDEMLRHALKNKKGNLLLYIYPSSKMSYSGMLANELLYNFPDSYIIIGRSKDNLVRCSFRSPKGKNMREIVQKALKGLDGFAGGHEQACGGTINADDFSKFVENVKDMI
ncbi:MAG: DHH family phosphoesterase [Candidatus Woesearchaeota archaeon]